MIRDRLHELRKNSNLIEDEVILDISSIQKENDIENALNEFTNVRILIQDIQENTRLMKTMVTEMSTKFQIPKGTSDELDEKRQANMSICQKIYNAMKILEVNLPFVDDNTAIARIKRYQFYFLREEFIKAWNEHEAFLLNYEEKVKKMLMKQAKIIDSNVNEEEIEELISNKTTSLFVENIVEETQNARRLLQDLITRQTELEKIEKSIIEVRDMFIRISTLVMEQSARIQIIEYHAQQTGINVEKGGENLEKARELKIKGLKRKTCILIWVTIILVVLILILVLI